jgi:hypothetical protein
MRLIAESVLPVNVQGQTYVQEEITQVENIRLLPPQVGKKFHAFCSPNNPGAIELIHELSAKFLAKVETATDLDQLRECEHMVVYLTVRWPPHSSRLSRDGRHTPPPHCYSPIPTQAKTWTRGAGSAAFAAEVASAMERSVPLLLLHEMPGEGGQAERHGVDFSAFFACPEGSTPQELIQSGIYGDIATPLKGGAWREASLVMLMQAFTAGRDADDVVAYRFFCRMLVAVLQAVKKLVNFAKRTTSFRRVQKKHIWAKSTEVSQAVESSEALEVPDTGAGSTAENAIDGELQPDIWEALVSPEALEAQEARSTVENTIDSGLQIHCRSTTCDSSTPQALVRARMAPRPLLETASTTAYTTGRPTLTTITTTITTCSAGGALGSSPAMDTPANVPNYDVERTGSMIWGHDSEYPDALTRV